MANLNLTQIVHMATSHIHAKLKQKQHWAPLVNYGNLCHKRGGGCYSTNGEKGER